MKKKKKVKPISFDALSKKEKFFDVFLFRTVYTGSGFKKNKVKIFKVFGTNFMRSRTRLARWFSKNKKYKKFELVKCEQISQKDVGDRQIKEINPVGKPKRIKKERIDLERLQGLKHKQFGLIYIANPKLMVSKDIVNENVLFWVPFDKLRMELKSILFDIKFFNLDIELKNKILQGTDKSRQAQINHVKEKIVVIERYSKRCMDLNLLHIHEQLDGEIKSLKKQFDYQVKENAEEIVSRVIKLTKKEIEDSTGKVKLRYTLRQCIRKAWRSNTEFYWEDLQKALVILHEKGYKVPKVQMAA